MDISHKFSADRPITSATDDKLGRTTFAIAIARAIAGWAGKDSLVVALYGPWGTGKSSIKEMTLEALRKQGSAMDVLQFNPWQFSGGNIQAAFFRDLAVALGQTDESAASKKAVAKLEAYVASLHLGSEVVHGIHGVARGLFIVLALLVGISMRAFVEANATLFGAVVLFGIGLEWILERAERIAAASARLETAKSKITEKTTAELKVALSDSLAARNRPVLIVMDDLDRLEKKDVRNVLTLVKANADFPKAVYLLLFQRDRIERGLQEEGEKETGSQFLEKIVQVGFDVPAADRDRINKILFAGLDEELNAADLQEHFDHDRWNTLFIEGLQEYFTTLRDVHRYLGTFAFHLALFRSGKVSEVNPIDLIAVETLRLFEPNVYLALPAAKLILTQKYRDMFPPTKEQVQSGITTLLEKAAKRKSVEAIMPQLFPHIQWAVSQSIFGGSTDEEAWYRELRVCSEHIFDRYFQFAIAERELSNARLQHICSLANNREALVKELENLDAEGLLGIAISRLEAFKQEIALEYADSFIPAIMDIGDRLSPDSESFFGMADAMHAVRIIFWYLIREPDPRRREEILIRAINASVSITIGARLVSLEEPTERRTRGYDQFLLSDDEALARLKQAIVERISRSANDGSLQKNPSLLYLLYHWRNWAGDEAPKVWVNRLLSTPEGVVAALRTFIRTMAVNGKKRTYFSLKDLEVFTPREEFANALTHLPQDIAQQMEPDISQFNTAMSGKDDEP